MRKPVILVGAGCKTSPEILECGIPVLSSWQAMDMFDNYHENYFGRPGIYGQRAANKILHEADQVHVVGNRMAIWNVGYEGIPAWKITDLVLADSKWMAQCKEWRDKYPLVESPAHDDTDGYINSYRFVERLQEYLRPDECIVTDMGTAHICAHQVLRLKPPQRIMSSGGLGEMGCGLPAAIGASFARDKGEVLCLAGDGGMMMNLQELQTIVHHKLPVKIIVFRNDGYLMIKHTQSGARQEPTAVDQATGVSCPSFIEVARAFGIPAMKVETWAAFDAFVPWLFSEKGPALIEYHMHPKQPLVPKLSYSWVDGKPVYDRFDRMSPHV